MGRLPHGQTDLPRLPEGLGAPRSNHEPLVRESQAPGLQGRGGVPPAPAMWRGLTSDGLAALCLRIAAALLQFVATLILTRRLGPADFGLFSLGFTVVMVASTVARLGVDKAATRAIAQRHATAGSAGVRSVHRTAMLVVLLASALIAAAIILASHPLAELAFADPALTKVLQVMGLAIVPFSLVFVVSAGFIGAQRVRSGLFIEALPFLLFAALLLVPSTGWNLIGVCGAYVLACVLSLLLAYAPWCRGLPRDEATTSQWRDLIETGWPIGLVAVLMLALTWLDVLILGLFADSRSVGTYYTVSRVGRLLALVAFAIAPVIAARVAVLSAQGDHEGVLRVFRASLVIVLAVNLPLLAVILAVPEMLLALFGEPFVAGATALRLHALGQFGGAFLFPAGALLVMAGRERLWRDVIALAALVYVAVVYLLTARYGLEGTAAGTAVGLLGATGLGFAAIRRELVVRMPGAAGGRREATS